jgi:hypothetical protein
MHEASEGPEARVVRAPEIPQELRGQVVRPLRQPLTKPVGRKLGGFFVVDVSPRSIVGIPALAVAKLPSKREGLFIESMCAGGCFFESKLRCDTLAMQDIKTVTIGTGTPALAFSSNTPDIDSTRELWFVHDGYLFEITTYSNLGDWLKQIIDTVQFP